MTDTETLSKLHGISMRLLKKADEVFRQCGIQYMLDAGTLLGAVRHKSFIPWDDDADICMTRENYNKLLKLDKSLFSGDFELIIPASDDRFYDFVPKIIYKKAVIGKDDEDYKFYDGKYSHPSLDIFVIDNVPNSKIGQRLHTTLLIFIYGLAMGHRRSLDYSKYSGMQKNVVKVLSKIGRHICLEKESNMYDSVAAMFEKKNKKQVMSTHSAMDAFGDCYEAKSYAKTINLEIDGAFFPSPKGYDEILKKHYGDYMRLPPKEKQKPKHLDFGRIEFWEG